MANIRQKVCETGSDMEIKQNSFQKLSICMLLPLRYEPNMRVPPQIGICSYLTNFGHDVTWVLRSEVGHKARSFLYSSVKVYALPYHHYFAGNSILAETLSKIPDFTLQRMRSVLKILEEGKYDLIFVRDAIFYGLLACYIKRRYKVPFVFELSNPLEQGWEFYKVESNRPKFLYYLRAKFVALMRLHLMKKADLVLVTTKWFEGEMVKKGISKSNLMPYPNGVDIESFLNKGGKNVCEEYHLGNSKVIIYVGTLGKARYLNVLVQAFSKVKKERGNVKLLMVGEGSDKDNLERFATELGIKDEIIFTGQVLQSEVPNFIAAADIGVSPVPPLSFYKVSSPIKMFEYMAMAKPVVANEEILEHKEVLEQSGGGILVPFTPEEFADAIIELLDNPKRAAEMGRRGREWVVKNRSYDKLAKEVEDGYYKVLKKEVSYKGIRKSFPGQAKT